MVAVVVSVDHPGQTVVQHLELASQKMAHQKTTRREPLEERVPAGEQRQCPGGRVALWYLSLPRSLYCLLYLRPHAMTPDEIR